MDAAPILGGDHISALARLSRAIEQHRAEPLAPTLSARGLGPYRGYAELLVAIRDIAERDGVRLAVVGESVRGEPLFTLEMGAPAAEHTSVIVAGIHPNEWIGIETGLRLCARLATEELGRSVIAFPLANPDGLLAVERNQRARRWRFVRHNANGIDLNRNFDVRWGHKSFMSGLLPGMFRPGSHAESEPEVAAIARHLEKFSTPGGARSTPGGARRIDRALSLHSFGGVVLHPSAYTVAPIDGIDAHRRWGERIASQIAARPYRVLPPSWWWFGLFTMGGLELDWFHERHGALSLLIECSRGGFGLTPERLLNPFAWFNPPALDEVASRIADAALPFVRGDA